MERLKVFFWLCSIHAPIGSEVPSVTHSLQSSEKINPWDNEDPSLEVEAFSLTLHSLYYNLSNCKNDMKFGHRFLS